MGRFHYHSAQNYVDVSRSLFVIWLIACRNPNRLQYADLGHHLVGRESKRGDGPLTRPTGRVNGPSLIEPQEPQDRN